MSPFRIPAAALLLSAGLLLAGTAPAHSQATKTDEPPKTKAEAKPKAKVKRATPTNADVPYGEHPRQVLDFYRAESEQPTPLVLYIHGGGWVAGDKDTFGAAAVERFRKAGISVAAINYRYTTLADEANVEPPVKWPVGDAARALQFLRSKAKEWNIDKTRIGATGGSAGACSSLWLAFHDDMAKPDSDDPIARESTRLTCAAVNGAQTSLDPKQLRAWMPNARYGGHAFGFRKPGQTGRDTEFQTFYDHREQVLPWIKEYSPYEHAGAGDPPIFLDYPAQDKPPVVGEEQRDPTHSAVMGLPLQEKLREHGVECHLMYPGHKDPEYANINEFLIAKLKPADSTSPDKDKDTPVAWKKTIIEGKFRSEGVAVADVNKDGQRDILVGDSWYEAPAWTKHDIRKPGDFGDGERSYSNCMTCWSDDVNGDGWPDELVIGFPGSAALWYENPKGKPGYWPQHEIWPSACNETPLYADLFGNGQRVLVMGWQPKGKDNEGQMAWFSPGSDPTQPWEMHPVSEPSRPNKPIPGTFRFSHGLGVGDLNADGRNDVICTDGWWEHPESARKNGTPWTFHPAQLQGAVADMIAYDVNGDSKADVIDSSAHQFGIWWYEQGPVKDGSPVFTKHDLFPQLVSETHALIAADINGDGLKDLVTGKRFWSHGRHEPGADKPAMLYWFEASRDPAGMTTFTPRTIDDQSGIGTQFVVTDFNGDGLLDIVTANKKGVFLFEQRR